MNTENLHNLLGIEECIRYYPPNIETIQDPEAILRNDREIDLYLHIPFCKAPCGFCPFNQYRYQEYEVKLYLSAIEQEIMALKTRHDLSQVRIRAIWIGGGTPSDLDEEALEKLLSVIQENFNLGHVKEFTIDVKPILSMITDSKLLILHKYNVNRISVGVQSTNQACLTALGRNYTPRIAFDAIEKIRQGNFAINIDMIYRLPGQTQSQVADDVDHVRSLGIDHISWFPYISHPGTPLSEKISRGEMSKTADRKQYFEMFNTILEHMNRAGYQQYTPYYYSREKQCQYHVDRWRMPQLEILGIGAGAFSFFNGWIYANAHSLDRYRKAVNEQKLPIVMGKKLSPAEKITRFAVLGSKFFTVNMEEFRQYSGVRMDVFYQKELELLERSGLIEIQENHVNCTLLGKAFNNDISMYFSADSARGKNQPQAVQLMNEGL